MAKFHSSFKENSTPTRIIESLGSSLDRQLHLIILNNTAVTPLYFENLQSLDPKEREEQISFYQNFLEGLSHFIKDLKKQKRFDESVILITSDRQKIPTTEGLVTTWEGINFSFISGSVSGPFQMGHIQKEHPKYKENYPGTWGLGVEGWTTSHFKDLVEDLIHPKMYNPSKNPWFHIKKGSITPKLRWGQTF